MLLDECAMHRLCLVNLWPTEHFIERAARSDSPPVSHQQWAPANRVVCLEGHWRRPLGAFIYRWSIARARPVIEDDTLHWARGDGWWVCPSVQCNQPQRGNYLACPSVVGGVCGPCNAWRPSHLTFLGALSTRCPRRWAGHMYCSAILVRCEQWPIYDFRLG